MGRLSALERFIKEVPEGGRIVGRMFRSVIVLGYRSPLTRLVDEMPDLAEAVSRYLHLRAVHFRYGDARSGLRALRMIDELSAKIKSAAAARVSKEAKEVALRELKIQRSAVAMGEPDLAAALAAAPKSVATAPATAASVATRLADVEAASQAGILSTIVKSPGTRDPLRLFLACADLDDADLWQVIWKKLDANLVNADLSQIAAMTDQEIIKAFRGNISNVKGLFQELAVWGHPSWASLERRILREAESRASMLSGPGKTPFRVRLIKEPLRDEAGKEIYDGVVMLVRPIEGKPGTFEAILDTAVQIKAERQPGYGWQVLSDIEREQAAMTKVVTSLDGETTYVLRHPPDAVSARRVAAAPRMAGRTQHAAIGEGVPMLYFPTLLDEKQLDTLVAQFMRWASKAYP